MKRRRTLIVSLLLVAALCMGIGYAALAGNLTITGSATITQQEFDVYFTQAEKDDVNTTTGVTVTVPDDTNFATLKTKEVNITVTGLVNEDDKAVIQFTGQNDNDCIMTLSAVPTYGSTQDIANGGSQSTDDNISISVAYEDDDSAIEAGGTKEVTVTINLDTININADPITTYFTLKLNATPSLS